MAGRLFLLLSCILFAFPFSARADDNLVELVKKTKPAVVLIQTFDDNNQPIGKGSGFFVNNKGHIVTNHHVLEGAYRATVKTSSGMEYPVEGIIAQNADADIVKLVINIPDANNPFLNLSEIVPSEGQDIFVIGNPLGLESTVSAGIVSAVRDIPAFGKILQITAPISPGSSGSPVINSKGEVIGIATLIITSGQNLNFAVPSDKIIALKEISQISLSNILPADSNDAQIFYQKGLKELWQENYASALTYFQKATEVNPQDSNSWFKVGYCYGQLGYYQDSINTCKMAINLKPDNADAYLFLGFAYSKIGRWQESIESLKKSIKFNPDIDVAYFMLAIAYGELGQYQDVIESYNQFIKINPNSAEAYYKLGINYRKLGSYQEAIDAYKEAIRIKPDFADAQYNLGRAYHKLGLYQDAIESYKQAVRINPDYTDAHYIIGLTYGNLDHDQDAIKSFKQAIRINPDFAEAHYNLGVAYANLSQWQEAIESYKQVIRIKPDDANSHNNLGASYLAVGEKALALEEYKILKTLDAEKANKLFNAIYP